MKKTFYTIAASFLLIFLLSFHTGIAQPLAGPYTINALMPAGGTNFQSFNDFATSINSNGVSAHVVVSVEPGSGPYLESVIFTNIPGVSDTSTITLEGNGEMISAVTSSASRHVIRLSNTRFFTINNLRVNYDIASTGGFYGIHIFGTGSDITVSNCVIDLGTTTSTLYGAIIASGSETSILETGDFHRLNILNNTTSGGGYGVSVFGLISNLASDIVIEGNNIFDFHSNGIYLRETNGAIIRDNHFDKSTPNVTSTNAIQLAQAANINGNIYNNFIRVSQIANGSQTIRGIYLFNGTGHKVYNNVIQEVQLTTGNFTAVEVRTGSTAPSIYYNTISLDHSAATSGNLYGIKEELSNTNSMLRNNMISISQQTSGLKSALVLAANSTVTSALNTDYNNFYVPGGNVAVRNLTTPTFYSTLSDWNLASTQDANSHDMDPMFVSSSNPVPTNLALNDLGTSLSGYTTDVLGNIRSSTPDIGAYEFIGVGISSIQSTLDVKTFPNPVMGMISLQITDALIEDLKISIHSMDGKMVFNKTFQSASSHDKLNLDLNSISSGVYMIKVLNGDKFWQSKFVKAGR